MLETCSASAASAAVAVLKVEEIEGRGRSLVSTQRIEGGQVVLRESPLLLYPASLSATAHYCSHCFRSLRPPTHVRCPSCPLALFCGPSCLSLSPHSHTPWLCLSLSALAAHHHHHFLSSSLDLQSQALFLISAYSLALSSPPRFRLLLSLQGDPPSSSSDLHSFLSSLPPPLEADAFSPALTAALLSRDRRNAFGLMAPFDPSTPDRSVRAYAIYLTASFFNHDCLPNACRFDYVDAADADIIVRAIHDIDPGREVCLSYFPVNWRYADRQRRLREDYGFDCSCDRCRVESGWRDDDGDGDGEEEAAVMDEDASGDEEIEASEDGDFPHAYFFVRYLCQKDNCGGTLAPLPPVDGVPSRTLECNVCGQLRLEDDQLQLGDDGDGGGSMVDD